jgi:hypothetical protein
VFDQAHFAAASRIFALVAAARSISAAMRITLRPLGIARPMQGDAAGKRSRLCGPTARSITSASAQAINAHGSKTDGKTANIVASARQTSDIPVIYGCGAKHGEPQASRIHRPAEARS